MARQHVHNRRAGRGSGGSSWISYSDIMAALVLVFVLFLVFNLYQYTRLMEEKAEEQRQMQIMLDNQKAQLDAQEGILIVQQAELDQAKADVASLQTTLDSQSEQLAQQTIILIGAQQELDQAYATLAEKETELGNLQIQLDAQREAFRAQTAELDNLVGVRTRIIQALSQALAANHISATVDPATGDIVLESTVFFDSNSSTVKPEGQELLRSFLPVYLGVLLSDEYSGYVGEIIVEGHTDSTGTYINNLKLSQNRALGVVEYCLNIVPAYQQGKLQSILTAKGRSYSDLIYNPDGTENKDASRRVEFKFRLKDSEMIDELNQILNGG